MKRTSLLTFLALALVSTCAFAAPATKAKPHVGLLSRLHSLHAKKPASAGRAAAVTGQIIGNKNTHVYHLPTDKSQLPAEKNRVYFKSEAAAIAAGYHHAGSASTGKGRAGKKSLESHAAKTAAKVHKAKSAGKGHAMVRKKAKKSH